MEQICSLHFLFWCFSFYLPGSVLVDLLVCFEAGIFVGVWSEVQKNQAEFTWSKSQRLSHPWQAGGIFYNHGDGQFSFLFSTRGLPFIAHLDSLPNFTRSSDGPVRLPIVDKYKVSSWKQLILFPKRKTEIYGSSSSSLHYPRWMSGRQNFFWVFSHMAILFFFVFSSLSFSFLSCDYPRAQRRAYTHTLQPLNSHSSLG